MFYGEEEYASKEEAEKQVLILAYEFICPHFHVAGSHRSPVIM
jgi:hypothetical protein